MKTIITKNKYNKKFWSAVVLLHIITGIFSYATILKINNHIKIIKNQNAFLKNNLKNIKENFLKITKSNKPNKTYAAIDKEKIFLINAISNEKNNVYEIMCKIENLIFDDLYLDKISFLDKKIIMEGASFSNNAISTFVKILEKTLQIKMFEKLIIRSRKSLPIHNNFKPTENKFKIEFFKSSKTIIS